MGQRGGKRPGAGRKRGQVNAQKKTIADLAKVHTPAALDALVLALKTGQSVMAAKELLDRAYGRAPQTIDHGVQNSLADLLREIDGNRAFPKGGPR